MKRERIIHYNDTYYETVNEAALDNGYTPPGMLYRLNRGYIHDLCDKNHPIYYKGKVYRTYTEAAKDNNVSTFKVKRTLKKLRYHTIPQDARRKPCTWNGHTYNSIMEAARALGISHSAMWQRYEAGYTSDASMKRSKRKVKAAKRAAAKYKDQDRRNPVYEDNNGEPLKTGDYVFYNSTLCKITERWRGMIYLDVIVPTDDYEPDYIRKLIDANKLEWVMPSSVERASEGDFAEG